MTRIFSIFLLVFVMLSCQKKEENKAKKVFKFDDKDAKEMHKIAYALGRQYAINMSEFKFDKETMSIFIQGLSEGHDSGERPSENMVHFAKRIDAIVRESRAEKAKEKKIEGEKFVADLLANDPSYKKTNSGLIYKFIKKGKPVGEIANQAFVAMRYESNKLDGTQYESTMSGNPRKMPLRGIFKAWQEAFRICGEGCEMEIIAPPSLTYGDNGALPRIAPGEYLRYNLYFLEYLPKGI